MIKQLFDNRTWHEIVGDLVSERTNPGDSIKLHIKYNGSIRPNINLHFSTSDPEKQCFSSSEEITSFLPESPYWNPVDDSTGLPIPGEFTKGFPDWRSFINDAFGFGIEIKKIINTGGRIFSSEEV